MYRRVAWIARIMLFAVMLMALQMPGGALASGTEVARIGNTVYPTLSDAVAAVPADGTPTTVTLLTNAVGDGIAIKKGQYVIIDMADHTYVIDGSAVGSTGTETNGFHLSKGSTVVIQNGTVTSSKAKILIQNYSDLTLENVVLDGSGLKDSRPYTLSLNCGKVNILGNTSIIAHPQGVAFDLYYWPKGGYPEGIQVTVNTTGVIEGPIELSEDGSGAASAAQKNELNIQNIHHKGSISNFLGAYDENVLHVTGGSFDYQPMQYTDGTVISDGNSYYVGAQADQALMDPATREVTVHQANGVLSAREGVKLYNATGSVITVNGHAISAGDSLVIHDVVEIPQTGDDANPLMWFVLLVAAGTGLLYMGLRRRSCS